MTSLSLAESRCECCTCADDLLTTAGVESARHLMAAELRLELLVSRSKCPDKWDDAAMVKGKAWQELRDCLAAERRNR